MRNCTICSEIESGLFPEPFRSVYLLNNRLCKESDHFVVYPSVSPLLAGHLLLFSKKHVNSINMLNSSAISDLRELAKELSESMSTLWEKSYIIEHGSGIDGSGSCGIIHAHLHMIPMEKKVVGEVNRNVICDYPPQYEGTLTKLLKKDLNGAQYLLYGSFLDKLHLSYNYDIPSQYMRRMISESMGIDIWDWKEVFAKDEFNATYKDIINMVEYSFL